MKASRGRSSGTIWTNIQTGLPNLNVATNSMFGTIRRGPGPTGSRQPKVGGNILAKSYVARPAIRLTMASSFLNRLAKVLKKGKSAACQRAIERLLAAVQTRYEDGQFDSASEAEAAFRELVNEESVCQK